MSFEHESEAMLEEKLIKHLELLCYTRINLKNLNDVKENFRKQVNKHKAKSAAATLTMRLNKRQHQTATKLKNTTTRRRNKAFEPNAPDLLRQKILGIPLSKSLTELG